MSATWFEEKLSRFENDIEFLTEGKILLFNEKVVKKMVEHGITRAELARKLGVSKAFVTKLLNGNQNMTIKTMVSIATAVDCNMDVDIYDKWLKPKTFYLVSDEGYKAFYPSAGEFDHDFAA